MCRCPAALSNGGIAGGADPAAFAYDFEIVGATSNTRTLATLVPNGARVLLRNLAVSLVFVAGAPAGDIGQVTFLGDAQAQRSTTDAQVVVFGPAPWGPPPVAPLQPGTGYQPPLLFGVGGVGIALAVAASDLNLVVGPGFAGFTIRGNVRGLIEVFEGAVRSV